MKYCKDILNLTNYLNVLTCKYCRVRIKLQLESSLWLGMCTEKVSKQKYYLVFIEAQVIHN